MTVLRRIAAERRAVLVPLMVALAIDLAMYFAVVRPLAQRVANRAELAATAEASRRAAEQERTAAHAALTGKARATADLTRFYGDILPASLTEARRITHLRLAQLARDSNLRYERAEAEPEIIRGSSLQQLTIRMVLAGSYADVREFIHTLETAPEFVVIDDVQLKEGAEGGNSGLVLTLELSTYFRAGDHGDR